MAAAIQVIQSVEAAAVLFSPARMRILEQLSEPDSAAGVARRLDLPRQQVTYHLRELEQAGLVDFVEERRKGNCIERVVRAAPEFPFPGMGQGSSSKRSVTGGPGSPLSCPPWRTVPVLPVRSMPRMRRILVSTLA